MAGCTAKEETKTDESNLSRRRRDGRVEGQAIERDGRGEGRGETCGETWRGAWDWNEVPVLPYEESRASRTTGRLWAAPGDLFLAFHLRTLNDDIYHGGTLILPAGPCRML
ncbi:uncharacterized protein SPSK_05670 [Sporothrix schenckii 1099-18]|uniref:Uncharacterized protein n=1 Tax=Sporothrix schenckii 1099-18 TaxID=1397361 RepID=A0A0F2LU51_SPOSC|nr:uncharacterized protein SPSK_05670 [Sporothrix schenckii 1099-18]KJR80982.1 hypothetical protein SPSK_05670 [Sporothrix schenckii 1099-18]